MRRMIRNIIIAGIICFTASPVTPQVEVHQEAVQTFLENAVQLISSKEKSSFKIILSQKDLCYMAYDPTSQVEGKNLIPEDARTAESVDGAADPNAVAINPDAEIVDQNVVLINPNAEALDLSPRDGDIPAAEAGVSEPMIQQTDLEKDLKECQAKNDIYEENEQKLGKELEECQLNNGAKADKEAKLEEDLNGCQEDIEFLEESVPKMEKELKECKTIKDNILAKQEELEEAHEECKLLNEEYDQIITELGEELEDCQLMNEELETAELELEEDLNQCDMLIEDYDQLVSETENDLQECQLQTIDQNKKELGLEEELKACNILTEEQKEIVDKYDVLLPYCRSLLDYITKLILDAKSKKENKETCEEEMARLKAALKDIEKDLNNAHEEIDRLSDPTEEKPPPNSPNQRRERRRNLVIAEPELRGTMMNLNKWFGGHTQNLPLWQRQPHPLSEQIGRLVDGPLASATQTADGKNCEELKGPKVTFILHSITDIAITIFDRNDDNLHKVRYTVSFTFTPIFVSTSDPGGELPVAITLAATVKLKANTVKTDNEFIRLIHLSSVKLTSIILNNSDQLAATNSQKTEIKHTIQKQLNTGHFFNLLWMKMSIAIQNETLSEPMLH